MLVLLALASVTEAAEFVLASGIAGTTNWEVTSPISGVPDYGYALVRFSATNPSAKPIDVGYFLNTTHRKYGENENLQGGTLTVPAKRSASVSLWLWRGAIPPKEYSQRPVEIKVTTATGNSDGTIQGIDPGIMGVRRFGAAVGSQVRLPAARSRRLDKQLGKTSVREYDLTSLTLYHATNLFDPQELPADWRVFSGLTSIGITPEDWDDLSPSVRDAIRTWIGLGGSVVVYSEDIRESERVRAQIIPDTSHLRILGEERSVLSVAPSTRTSAAMSPDPSANPRENFAIFQAPSPVNTELIDLFADVHLDHGGLDFPMRDSFGERSIPFGFLCFVLVVFAIIVGPINLLFWAPAGKRHRLFFTTPIISITASSGLLMVMLFQDGLSIEGRRFTILDLAQPDAAQPNAIVFQEQFTRTGMASAGGFAIEEGLIAKLPDGHFTSEPLTVRDNQAIGKWHTSRRDSSLSLAGTVPLRWHVSLFEKSDDAVRLRLELPLTDLDGAWFIDEYGRVWQWDRHAISADGTITFTLPNDDTPNLKIQRNVSGMRSQMVERASDLIRPIIGNAVSDPDQHNRFWAITSKGEAGARPTHPKIKWLESTLVITSKVAIP